MTNRLTRLATGAGIAALVLGCSTVAPHPAGTASGYAGLRALLQKESAAFGKPVVLVHGDSHFFRIDKPLSPMVPANLAPKP